MSVKKKLFLPREIEKNLNQLGLIFRPLKVDKRRYRPVGLYVR